MTYGRRLRRNYLWIYGILGAARFAKKSLFPGPASSFEEFLLRGAVGPFSGQVVILLGAVHFGVLALIAIGTIGMTRATGEILPRFSGGEGHDSGGEHGERQGLRARLFPAHRRQQYLAWIITDKRAGVSRRILSELQRGVTALEGKGMYTGRHHSILMCAVTVTEIHNLKATIAREDPNAFVIVSPAHEVLGLGFNLLEKK